jgi:hypothetical protein
MEHIGFIAESVRVPVSAGSLIILVLGIQENPSEAPIRRGVINNVYEQASQLDPNGYLKYSQKQNVSGDILGTPHAATVIEGDETHTRTADLSLDLASIPGFFTGRSRHSHGYGRSRTGDPGRHLWLVRQRDGQLRQHAWRPNGNHRRKHVIEMSWDGNNESGFRLTRKGGDKDEF